MPIKGYVKPALSLNHVEHVHVMVACIVLCQCQGSDQCPA